MPTNMVRNLLTCDIPVAMLFLAGLFVPGSVSAGDLVVTVVGADGTAVEHTAVLLTATSGQRPGPQQLVVVDQRDMQYQPWVTAIRRGTGVVFRNSDEITHHVYSFSPAKRLSFRLRSGESQPQEVMDEAGVVVLGCNIHDWMVGYVHVSDADLTAITGADGRVTLTGLSDGEWQVSIWHPGLDESSAPGSQTVHLRGDDSPAVEFRLTTPLRETGPRRPMDEAGYGPG